MHARFKCAVLVISLTGAVLGCLVGCRRHVRKQPPAATAVSIQTQAADSHLEATLVPYGYVGKYSRHDRRIISGWKMMYLFISNKTAHPVEIDWDRTKFLDDGQESGPFLRNGTFFMDKQKSQLPSIVLPGGEWGELITPAVNVTFGVSRARGEEGWHTKPMESGRKGVLLVLQTNEGTKYTYLDFEITPPSRSATSKATEPKEFEHRGGAVFRLYREPASHQLGSPAVAKPPAPRPPPSTNQDGSDSPEGAEP